MATYAKFNTAYLQYARMVDAKLSAAVNVNQLVTYNPSTKVLAASDDKTASNSAIIALSDRNIGIRVDKSSVPYAHTPIENKTWQYDGQVAATVGDATKKVVIYMVKDPMDVETYTASSPEQLN
jgi:hypothetical protein